MSVRAGKVMTLAGLDHANKTNKELQRLFKNVLNNGMHGLCFSTYVESQNPW